MAEPIFGTDVILSMRIGAEMRPLLCATDCSYQCIVELIEKTGPNSGGAREWMPRLEEHVSSVTGLTTILSDETISIFYSLDKSVRRAEQYFELSAVDSDANTFMISGNGILGTQGFSAPADDFTNASIEIKWQGSPTMTNMDGIDDSAECVAVELPDGISFPNRISDVPYEYSLTLIGSQPFSIENTITDPDSSWLEMAIDGQDAVFSGTPPPGGPSNVPVSFTITNCGGSVDYEGTISD